MEKQSHLQSPLQPGSLGKRALAGAVIGLVLIVIFLVGVKDNPNWPTYWRLRPLIVVPLAGAVGGSVYYFLDYMRYQAGWNRVLVTLASLLIYIVGLWMGFVLGLDGTLWN